LNKPEDEALSTGDTNMKALLASTILALGVLAVSAPAQAAQQHTTPAR
jgi:hypothetical protein